MRQSKYYRIFKTLRRELKSTYQPYIQSYPLGHYYCPVPDRADILNRQRQSIERLTPELHGIDMREEAQLALAGELGRYAAEMPFPAGKGEGCRYYLENSYFSPADATVLYGMIRHFRPQRVIEIGSGYSSALMLDTNDLHFDGAIEFTFIEPYPERLNRLLGDSDRSRCQIISKPVQAVELSLFDVLATGDILFVDTSHVAKAGNDLVRILFDIIPRLKPGVIVHFHDIYWPFDYPVDWLTGGRSWNEAYLLRAFLQYNKVFTLLYFNAFMVEFHHETLAETLPLCLMESDYRTSHGASSLWLVRAA